MNKENCALKLVNEIILYYDARSKKHQITMFITARLIDFHPYLQVALCKLLSQFTKPYCERTGTCHYTEDTDVQLLGSRYHTVFVRSRV